MSRFATLAESVTAVDTLGPIGFRDLNAGDRRVFVQFESANGDPFAARIYGTLNYDYGTNVGGPWRDVTKRFFPEESESFAEWGLFGGFWQRRRPGQTDDPISESNVYAADDDFIPAAILINVSSVTSGDALNVYFGV